MAKHLEIIVTENGREKAHVTLPALAIDELESLIPESAKEVANVDIVALRQQAQRSGYKAQAIFEATEGAKTLSVKLII